MRISKTTLKCMYAMREKSSVREWLSDFLISDTGTLLTSNGHIIMGLNLAGRDVTARDQGVWHAVSLNPTIDHDLTFQDGRLLCDGTEVPFKFGRCPNVSACFGTPSDLVDPFETPIIHGHFNVVYTKAAIDFLEEKRFGTYKYKSLVSPSDKSEMQRVYQKDNKLVIIAAVYMK